MKVRWLGAHHSESRDTKVACLLIDDTLAVDAGALSAGLTFQEQLGIKRILITHHHYDRIKDIPMLGLPLDINSRHTSRKRGRFLRD